MSALADIVDLKLFAHGAMTAKQIAKLVDEPIEDVYAALVELDGADRAYIATQRKRYDRRAGDRTRLWASRTQRA